MDIKENLATNITKYRKAHNLTQAELAEKLNYSDKAISKWERGEAVPDLTVLKQLADMFGVKIDDLIAEPKSIKPLIKDLGKRRISLSLWTASIVWLVAILAFAFMDIIIPSIKNSWLFLIIAIPITLIVLLVLTSVWGKNIWNYVFASLLSWSTLTAVYLILLFTLYAPPPTLWEIFLVGIPLQVFISFLFLWKHAKKK